MDRNKKILIIFGIIFIIILLIIAKDIANRTTFPDSKGALQDDIVPENPLPKMVKYDLTPYLVQV